MSIEQDLQRALARKPAPSDIAERVIARLNGAPVVPRRHAAARRPVVRWLAAAAAVAIVATGAARYAAQRQVAAEAERVKHDIVLALQITSEKLAIVQRRIDASNQDRQQGAP